MPRGSISPPNGVSVGDTLTADEVAGIKAATTLDGTHPPLVKGTDSLSDVGADERLLSISDVVHSTYYAASSSFGAPTIVLPADRRSLVVPTDGGIKIGDGFFRWSGIPNIDMDVAANWDDSQYATALTRRGLDPILYMCQHTGQLAPDFIYSMNASYPSGYTADNSRKVGGGHTLPADVGTISGHPLSGYLCGDLLPPSIWDLLHMPDCVSPTGMTYLGWAGARVKAPGFWSMIYLASGTGSNTASAWDATISDTRDWNTFVADFAAVGMFLPTDTLFQILAYGSPEQVNINGSLDPVKTGKIGTYTRSSGSGLNDFSIDRTLFSRTDFAQSYEFTIDATGTPDSFKWRQRYPNGTWGSYTTGVAITGDWQTIADGLKIKFAATTGHTLNDVFMAYCMDAPVATNGVRMISDHGVYGACGMLWQWLSDQSYRFDGAANHTHQVTVSGDPETVTSGNPSGDVAPAWGWVALPGSRGQLYKQGSYGDVKLAAGGNWGYSSLCGSLARFEKSCRWDTYSDFGARGCARTKATR